MEDPLRLGADEVVISRDADAMGRHARSFDFILDTVAAEHDIDVCLRPLRRDGNLILVGAPAKPLAVSASPCCSAAAAFPARSSAASPRPSRCLASAGSTSSRPMSK